MGHSRRQMKLGLFIQAAGHHAAGWRYPGAESGGENLPLLKRLATAAEQAKFDLIFMADGLTTSPTASASTIARFEPITLLSALAMVTDTIGLAATASTTYSDPFSIARAFASLDHLSGGRAAWNVVTSSSPDAGLNFGQPKQWEHALRYERAREFVEVVKGLWDSWEDDAFIRNKETGEYIEKSKLHTLDHRGQYFSVRGPLNVSRTPQGHPVVIQAGSSEAGQDLAARTAEVVFTAQQTLQEAQAFYSLLKARTFRYGRSPEHLLILPGVMPIIGKTEREAKEKYEYLQGGIDTSKAVAVLSERLGHDISGFPLDGPVPELPESEGLKSRAKLLTELARNNNLTLRQLYYQVAGARGHRILCGDAEQIADELEEWFLRGAADGFNVMPPFFPSGLDDFIAGVIPILRERGLFRTQYEAATLRGHLGLPVPVNRYSEARTAPYK